VTGHTTKQEDEVTYLFPARTLDTILFFSDRGKVYSEKAYQIPDADRSAKGIPIVNVLSLEANETITAALAVPVFDKGGYCTMVTRLGKIKRVALSELAAVRPSGLIIFNLGEGDLLGWARLTSGKDEIILVTEQGQALRYSEKGVRPTGRNAGGVVAISLAEGDSVTSMDVIEAGGDLLVVTLAGFGKRTPLGDYPAKGRATGGVQTINKLAIDKIGAISTARVVQEADDLTIISSAGVVLRTRVKDVPKAGRTARCVQLMDVGEDDAVASMARISDADLRKVGAAE
jgi:DNA gyrase subunit A